MASSGSVETSLRAAEEAGPARITARMRYGDDPANPPQWIASGELDLAQRSAHLVFRGWHDMVQRETVVSGTFMYTRPNPESAVWAKEEASLGANGGLTDKLFGFGRLIELVDEWETVGHPADTDQNGRVFRGKLPRKLQSSWGPAFMLVFAESLPSALIRHRLIEVVLDQEGRLAGVSVTTDRHGIRNLRKWLIVELAGFGEVSVPAIDTSDARAMNPITQAMRHVGERARDVDR